MNVLHVNLWTSCDPRWGKHINKLQKSASFCTSKPASVRHQGKRKPRYRCKSWNTFIVWTLFWMLATLSIINSDINCLDDVHFIPVSASTVQSSSMLRVHFIFTSFQKQLIIVWFTTSKLTGCCLWRQPHGFLVHWIECLLLHIHIKLNSFVFHS